MTKKGVEPSFTRTFALVGHRSAGKTSLGDLLLQATKATRSIGRVEEGTSLLDHTAEARQKRQTLELGTAWLSWRDHILNLVDLPGAPDLIGDTTRTLALVDAFVLVVAANDGPGPVGRRVLESVGDQAGLVVIQQCDHGHDWKGLIASIQEATARKVLPLQLPFYDDEGAFAGVVDLQAQKVLRYDPDGSGAFSREPLPDRLGPAVAAAWERVIETVAVADDERLERYLEYLELPHDEVIRGLAEEVRAGRILPVYLTSATQAVGALPLLDALVELVPEPALPASLRAVEVEGFLASVLHTSIDAEGRPFSLLRVWSGDAGRGGRWTTAETGATSKVRKLFQIRGPRRTTAHTTGAGAVVATWDPVNARAGETLTDGERLALPTVGQVPVMVRRRLILDAERDTRQLGMEALERALPVLRAMDPALTVDRDPLGGEVVLGGSTEGQIRRAAGWLTRRMGVPVRLEMPRVAYREAPLHGAEGAEGLHIREVAGLVEEYGRCCFDLVPDADCEDLSFVAEVAEDLVPRRFHRAVAEGAREAAMRGPLAGYPIIGARVTCTDGQYDMLCSSDDHFQKAASAAMREALEASGTRLLEPWQRVSVYAPAEAVGAVLADLTGHRGRILDVRVSRQATVLVECPERELGTLAARLGALTGGRAWFQAEHSHYDVLPEALVGEAMRMAPGPPPRRTQRLSLRGMGASG